MLVRKERDVKELERSVTPHYSVDELAKSLPDTIEGVEFDTIRFYKDALLLIEVKDQKLVLSVYPDMKTGMKFDSMHELLEWISQNDITSFVNHTEAESFVKSIPDNIGQDELVVRLYKDNVVTIRRIDGDLEYKKHGENGVTSRVLLSSRKSDLRDRVSVTIVDHNSGLQHCKDAEPSPDGKDLDVDALREYIITRDMK